MEYKGIRIGFDFCSGGVWGVTAQDNRGMGICLDGGEDQGVSPGLARVIDEWNGLFDRVVTDYGKKYVVSQEVADLFKPLGLYLAGLVKKELPDMKVEYYHYSDYGETEIIEVK